jgi:hypothetical protein
MTGTSKSKSGNKTTQTDEPIALYLSKLGSDVVREDKKLVKTSHKAR